MKRRISHINYLKAFIVASSIPCIIWTFLYLGIADNYNPTYDLGRTYPISLPILFGLTNILQLRLRTKIGFIYKSSRYIIVGALYGILLSSIGTFGENYPQLLFQRPDHLRYLGLCIAPVIYALIRRFIIFYINKIFDLD